MLYPDRLVRFGEKSLDFGGFVDKSSLQEEIVEIYSSLDLLKILSWQIALEDLID